MIIYMEWIKSYTISLLCSPGTNLPNGNIINHLSTCLGQIVIDQQKFRLTNPMNSAKKYNFMQQSRMAPISAYYITWMTQRAACYVDNVCLGQFVSTEKIWKCYMHTLCRRIHVSACIYDFASYSFVPEEKESTRVLCKIKHFVRRGNKVNENYVLYCETFRYM